VSYNPPFFHRSIDNYSERFIAMSGQEPPESRNASTVKADVSPISEPTIGESKIQGLIFLEERDNIPVNKEVQL